MLLIFVIIVTVIVIFIITITIIVVVIIIFVRIFVIIVTVITIIILLLGNLLETLKVASELSSTCRPGPGQGSSESPQLFALGSRVSGL